VKEGSETNKKRWEVEESHQKQRHGQLTQSINCVKNLFLHQDGTKRGKPIEHLLQYAVIIHTGRFTQPCLASTGESLQGRSGNSGWSEPRVRWERWALACRAGTMV